MATLHWDQYVRTGRVPPGMKKGAARSDANLLRYWQLRGKDARQVERTQYRILHTYPAPTSEPVPADAKERWQWWGSLTPPARKVLLVKFGPRDWLDSAGDVAKEVAPIVAIAAASLVTAGVAGAAAGAVAAALPSILQEGTKQAITAGAQQLVKKAGEKASKGSKLAQQIGPRLQQPQQILNIQTVARKIVPMSGQPGIFSIPKIALPQLNVSQAVSSKTMKKLVSSKVQKLLQGAGV